MKKTLAIVLALVMVLAMIPAMVAGTETKIESNDYDLTVNAIANDKLGAVLGSAKTADAVTGEYEYDNIEAADDTDKWAENAKMAALTVKKWDAAFPTLQVKADDAKKDSKIAAFKAQYALTVDGDKINVGTADYAGLVDVQLAKANKTIDSVKYEIYTPYVVVPVALTKAGYQDTLKIALTYTDAKGNTIKETAVISLTLKNVQAYKDEKTATITNIGATGSDLSAYIVGSKIYLDYVDDAAPSEIKVTFANEAGAPFSVITYAYNPVDKDGADVTSIDVVEKGKVAGAYALESSAAKFAVAGVADKNVKFLLETKAANYATKLYDIVVREYIREEDPKGIYFAETTKTIAMGEVYTPVVMGVKTGKPVDATLFIETYNTDAEVIDLVNDDKSVIGTREGVAYVTAQYATNADSKNFYTASSMKIIVTLPGESIPELDPAAEVYYVTCRALNVRAGAGTSYKKVDLIHRGDAVKVVELKNGWAKLDNGTYVCAKYISK